MKSWKPSSVSTSCSGTSNPPSPSLAGRTQQRSGPPAAITARGLTRPEQSALLRRRLGDVLLHLGGHFRIATAA